MPTRSILSAVLLVATGVGLNGGPLQADQLRLANGDVMTGKVEKMLDGKVHFQQEYGPRFELPWSKVTGFVSDGTAKVEFDDGSHLTGEVTYAEEGTVIVRSERVEEVGPMPLHSVVSINRPAREPATWSLRLAAGVNITEGNTKSSNLWGTARGKRESQNDRIVLELSGYYAEQDGVETQKEETANAQYDYYVYEDFYVWGRLHFHHDSFEELNLRSRISAGIGYQVLKTPTLDLRTEVGLSYMNEDFKRPLEDEDTVTGRVALLYEHEIFEDVILSEYLELFPAGPLRNSQLSSETYLSFAIWEDFSLQLGFLWFHDADPPMNLERNDFKYLLGLQYTF